MSEKASSSRRRFLKAVPAVVAGAMGTNVLAQQGQNAGPITAQMVDCAEPITGLEFHSDEEAAIARTLTTPRTARRIVFCFLVIA